MVLLAGSHMVTGCTETIEVKPQLSKGRLALPRLAATYADSTSAKARYTECPAIRDEKTF
ncbi:hypothetical protein DYU11_29500 [Fibrisoma montanum]|uniref:Uncharacterized protein n=2 Tax=Fibrisoma montanum TaxID=2305895 RepID=A0A418LXP7_9BACT|nr:hypothetical protein DYU11_29500 [Fibrisoma montanum]